jgi:NADH:ubiquinone oxidoreductase subunit 4 (subunit M)
VPVAAGLAIAMCVLATLWLGVVPGPVLDYSAQSAHQLLSDRTAPIVSRASAAAVH